MGMDILPRIGATTVAPPTAGRPTRIARVLGGRISGRAGTIAFYIFMIAVFAVFGISTVPGVRPAGHTGYNLILDGILNNLAYALSPVLCFLRARKATAYRSSWRILAIGLALYGFGNIYWTIFIRPLADPPFPSVADGFWLSFYPCAFIALLLVMRDFAGKLPLSLWLDGIVGGLAVAAIAAAVVGPVLKAVHANGDSTAAIVTTEAYPLLDVLLLLVVTALEREPPHVVDDRRPEHVVVPELLVIAEPDEAGLMDAVPIVQRQPHGGYDRPQHEDREDRERGREQDQRRQRHLVAPPPRVGHAQVEAGGSGSRGHGGPPGGWHQGGIRTRETPSRLFLRRGEGIGTAIGFERSDGAGLSGPFSPEGEKAACGVRQFAP